MNKKYPFIFLSAFFLCSCNLGGSSMASSSSSSVAPISSASQTSSANVSSLVLEQGDGYNLKFNNIGASYYLVKDNNDYRDTVRIEGNSSDKFFSYKTEVVGKHQVYIEAYDANGNKIKKSNTLEALEVEPVYSYSPFSGHFLLAQTHFEQYGVPAELYQQAEEFSGRHQTTHYYFLDKDLNWTARGSMNKGNEATKYDEIDFSVSPHFDTILDNLKATGQNVLLLHTHYASIPEKVGNSWWYPSNEDNAVLRYMDRAWARGIKTIVTDNGIYSAINKGSNKFTGDLETLKKNVQGAVKARLFHTNSTETDLTPILKHKGFFGFNCPDEPRFKSPTFYAMAYAAAYIEEIYKSNSTMSKRNKPVIFTNFLPYDLSCFESSVDNYKQYIRDWAEISGADYIFFDMYNYTTHPYAAKDVNNNMRCAVKDAYLAYDTVRKEFPNLKIGQTINCGSLAGSNYQSQTVADIFAPHMTTTAAQWNGHSLFTFSPFDIGGTWKENAVNCNQTKTNFFNYFVEANKQVEFAKGLLKGYKISEMEFDQNPSSGYGAGIKLMKSTFANNGKTAIMYVNYETDSAHPYNATANVGTNKTVYSFGNGKTQEPKTSSGNITLKPGEAIIVFDK